MQDIIFKEYDIRGIYCKQFDLHFAFQLGRAFASYLRELSNTNHIQISIGHDTRLSSKPITQKLSEGL